MLRSIHNALCVCVCQRYCKQSLLCQTIKAIHDHHYHNMHLFHSILLSLSCRLPIALWQQQRKNYRFITRLSPRLAGARQCRAAQSREKKRPTYGRQNRTVQLTYPEIVD